MTAAISLQEWSRRWLLCVAALAALMGSYLFVMSARPDVAVRTRSPREWAAGTRAGLRNARRSFPFHAVVPTTPRNGRWKEAGVRRFTQDRALPVGSPRRSQYGDDWSTFVRAFNRATARRLSDDRQLRIREVLMSFVPSRDEQDAVFATAIEDLSPDWTGNAAEPPDDQTPPELVEIADVLTLELGLSIRRYSSGTQQFTLHLDRFSGLSPVPLASLGACDVRYHFGRRILLLRERATDRRIVFHVASWTVLSEDPAQ